MFSVLFCLIPTEKNWPNEEQQIKIRKIFRHSNDAITNLHRGETEWLNAKGHLNSEASKKSLKVSNVFGCCKNAKSFRQMDAKRPKMKPEVLHPAEAASSSDSSWRCPRLPSANFPSGMFLSSPHPGKPYPEEKIFMCCENAQFSYCLSFELFMYRQLNLHAIFDNSWK